MATEEQAREIKNRHSIRLLQQPGVAGVGVERDAEGDYRISIHLDSDDPAVQAGLPTEIEGCPVRLIHSGPFRKLSSD
ncbi:MAG TPA: hypothetical protein VN924_24780 [Bryobacteraceae bacterium]|nr:hypothetical protein [Bryobacteraceae bacterium]